MATPEDGRTTGVTLGANPNHLFNEHEAAARLGLTVATLRRWRWARQGPAWVKIGAAVRYSPTDLTAFIEAGRHQPNNGAA